MWRKRFSRRQKGQLGCAEKRRSFASPPPDHLIHRFRFIWKPGNQEFPDSHSLGFLVSRFRTNSICVNLRNGAHGISDKKVKPQAKRPASWETSEFQLCGKNPSDLVFLKKTFSDGERQTVHAFSHSPLGRS